MKKIISIILSLLLCVGALTGCGLFVKNNERDLNQAVVNIGSITYQQTDLRDERVVGIMEKRNQDGSPKYVTEIYQDKDGQDKIFVTDTIELEEVKYNYTTPEIVIRKSQLVNYVNTYGNQFIEQKETVEEQKVAIEKGVKSVLDMIIATELVLAEADKHFYVGNLYWTQEDIKNIQHSVYDAIDDQIFDFMNTVLERNEEEPREKPVKEEETETTTTYPTGREETEEAEESPRYYKDDAPFQRKLVTGEEELYWYDEWYTDKDSWYIYDQKNVVSYPGMYGDAKEKSLAREALNSYLAYMFENSEYIIGLTDEQKQQLEEEKEFLTSIQKNKGVEYVYPHLGNSLMIKLLIGNTFIKNAKNEKLQEYLTRQVSVTEEEIVKKYNEKLEEQKLNFMEDLSNYDSAIDNDELILYTPSDKYYWVKHILLPFSSEQEAELKRIQKREGKTDTEEGNKEVIEKEREKLAKDIIVYPHKDGEDDLTRPKKAVDVVDKIMADMERFKNSPYEAERAFNDFIFEYNTDPGIFNNDKGYKVIAQPVDDSEEAQEQGIKDNGYMEEFTLGSWQFRSGNYKVGQVLKDYVITDYGIHIMYYASDPYHTDPARQKGLKDYVTPGKYQYIFDLIKDEALTAKSANVYALWEKGFVGRNKTKYATIKDKVVDGYIKDLNKDLFG